MQVHPVLDDVVVVAVPVLGASKAENESVDKRQKSMVVNVVVMVVVFDGEGSWEDHATWDLLAGESDFDRDGNDDLLGVILEEEEENEIDDKLLTESILMRGKA